MKHPTEITGFNGSIKEAAKAVAQMRYDCVSKFLKAFSDELKKQSVGDKKRGRHQLAALLNITTTALDLATETMDIIWKLCKKYMQ